MGRILGTYHNCCASATSLCLWFAMSAVADLCSLLLIPVSMPDTPSLSQDSYDDAGQIFAMHGGGIIEVPEVPGDDYDDANEVSDVSEDYDDVKGVCDPEDPISGQNDWEDTGTEEDSDRKTESETGERQMYCF